MGFTIFTASGTFNPADHGLKTGDAIHVIAIGGGGGGGAYSYDTQGTAGGTTSFGSYLSCPGGNPGTSNKNAPTFQTGSCQGGVSTLDNYTICGGVGGDGWYPGLFRTGGLSANFCLPRRTSFSVSNGDGSGGDVLMIPGGQFQVIGNRPFSNNQTCSGSNKIAATSGVPYGNPGFGYSISAGGIGYGAGGGCGTMHSSDDCQGSGGNSGVLKHLDLVLPNTNSIAITIGAGGKGCYSSSSKYTYYNQCGGGGASGCVAIFW